MENHNGEWVNPLKMGYTLWQTNIASERTYSWKQKTLINVAKTCPCHGRVQQRTVELPEGICVTQLLQGGAVGVQTKQRYIYHKPCIQAYIYPKHP